MHKNKKQINKVNNIKTIFKGIIIIFILYILQAIISLKL